MAQLTVTPISKSGGPDLAAALSNTADSGGDQVPYASGLLIAVNNGDVSAKVVTVSAPVPSVNCGNYGDLALPDLTINIAAGETIPFSIPDGYAVNGNLSWTYDAVTSVTVEVFSIAP